ncbi:Uncharacterized protein APZ42_030062 [Daphnia magna]|uniref:Uncharacterized protein n=1 Tax=Daphnia magna TaxID=35525 RepID=A0A164P3G1_9CRUS|nr:Uncharacterized protein APZ42_030062 [Daphnia magna]
MTKKDTIAYLMVDGSSTNTQVSIHNQYDIQDPLPTGTKFEYIVDHSIRLINTNICIVTNKNNQIMAENCIENTSRWILNLTNYQWISLETGLCITLHDEEKGRVRLATLKTCSRPETISESQQLDIEILTTNPDVFDNFPDASIDEFEEIQLEQRTSVTTTVSSSIFGGLLRRNHGKGNIIWDMIAWGFMKHGTSTDEKCLTHNGVNKAITLEACDPNWIKCQTRLQKLITNYLTQTTALKRTQQCSFCTNAQIKVQSGEHSITQDNEWQLPVNVYVVVNGIGVAFLNVMLEIGVRFQMRHFFKSLDLPNPALSCLSPRYCTSLNPAITTQSSTTTEKINTEATTTDKIQEKTNQSEIISSTKPTISVKYLTPSQTREHPRETTTTEITKSKDDEGRDIEKNKEQKSTTQDESEIRKKI